MSEPAISKPPATAASLAHNRIASRFRELSQRGELGIVAYVTAGDPSLAASEEIVLAAAEAGADVIELGVPFSDPVADGPTIQRASERALRQGTTLSDVVALASRVRARSEVPLVLFSYYNPILQLGLERFAKSAAEAGVDGVLATDPRNPQARFLKGVLQTDQGNADAAIAIFQGLTEDYPELPEPYNNLAVIWAKQGQYEKARRALELALASRPDYAIAHENLGDIYARLSSAEYDRALALDKSNKSAQSKLALVRQLFAVAPSTSAPKPAAQSTSSGVSAAPAATVPVKK